jgi:hypothetical protein
MILAAFAGLALTIPGTIVAKTEPLTLTPNEGKIGDKIHLAGIEFTPGELYSLYFSSDSAGIGGKIDSGVTHYQRLTRDVKAEESSLSAGEFDFHFTVPEELADGEDIEYVHNGGYYVYITYRNSKEILDSVSFTVIGAQIKIEPTEGTVGSAAIISGEGFRRDREIRVKYDGDEIEIVSGDTTTDSEGNFTCDILIPESPALEHIISVVDGIGNKPETEFSVLPQIFIDPTTQAIDQVVNVRGTGFGMRENIILSLDGHTVPATPASIVSSLHTNYYGSFNSGFTVPPYPAYVSGDTAQVTARDESYNTADAELNISATPANMRLRPETTLESPGHVGMELTAIGVRFLPDTEVTVTYEDNDKKIVVATTTVDISRNFSIPFTIPPSIPGNHTITVFDCTNYITATCVIESDTPPMPVPLSPGPAAKEGEMIRFDWEDVADPSGVTYKLQIGTDAVFANIILEKPNLIKSEYALTENEKLTPNQNEQPYYWRVKAIDGTSLEGEWTVPLSFYVNPSSPASTLPMATYIGIGVGVVTVTLGIRLRKKKTTDAFNEKDSG